MSIRFRCSACDVAVRAPDHLAGKKLRCPKCKAVVDVPPAEEVEAAQGMQAAPSETMPTLPAPDVLAASQPTGKDRRWRVASLPWIVTVLVLGFLPWSEMSCNSREFPIRVTQSGYQAVVGKASMPRGIAEAVQAKAKADKSSQEAYAIMAGHLEAERADSLQSFSPFLAVFWVGMLTLLVAVSALRISRPRLVLFASVGAVAFSMLLVQLAVDLPLERRAGHVIAALVQEKQGDGIMAAAAFSVGKTPWFWLAALAFVLAGASEAAVWVLRRPDLGRTPLRTPVLIGGAFAVVSVASVALLIGLRASGMSAIEGEMTKIRKDEQEVEVRRDAVRREREAEAERQRAESARQQKEVEEATRQEREEAQRLAAERTARLAEEERRRKLALEELEGQRAAAWDKARLEAEKKSKEEAERKVKEEEKRQKEFVESERERKAALEKRDLAYYPQPLTLRDGKTAEQWNETASASTQTEAAREQARFALAALKEEGMPFLLALLKEARVIDVEGILRVIRPEFVHPNDAGVLVACLDKQKARFNGRMTALQYLAKIAGSKKHIKRIRGLTVDIAELPGRQQAEVRQLLKQIEDQ